MKNLILAVTTSFMLLVSSEAKAQRPIPPSAPTPLSIYTIGQLGTPLILVSNGYIGNNGALILGTHNSNTVTFSASSGTGVTVTFSGAEFTGTSTDVGTIVTEPNGAYATITAAVSTVAATATITGTLSCTAACTSWTYTATPITDLVFPTYVYVYVPAGSIQASGPEIPASTQGTSTFTWYYALFTSKTVATLYSSPTYTTGTAKAVASTGSTVGFTTTGPGVYTQTTNTNILAYQYNVTAGFGAYDSLQMTSSSGMSSSANQKSVIVGYGGCELIFYGAFTTAYTNPIVLTMSTTGIVPGFEERQITSNNLPVAQLSSGYIQNFPTECGFNSAGITIQYGLLLASGTDWISLDSVLVNHLVGNLSQ